MMPPKIEICIEGYNIEQTDFYIAHILDKYNSLNELYKKSCEHIVFLEKECKEGFGKALSDLEDTLIQKLDSFESRLSNLENALSIETETMQNPVSKESEDKFKAELSDFHSELKDIKSLFAK